MFRKFEVTNISQKANIKQLGVNMVSLGPVSVIAYAENKICKFVILFI